MVDTDKESEDESLEKILARLEELGFIASAATRNLSFPNTCARSPPLLASQNFPDLPTLIIHLLSEYLAPERQRRRSPRTKKTKSAKN